MVFEYLQIKKKWSWFIFIFNRISKIFNGNPLYLTDDVATLTLILTQIYEGSLKKHRLIKQCLEMSDVTPKNTLTKLIQQLKT